MVIPATISIIVAVLCLVSIAVFFSIKLDKPLSQTFILSVAFIVAILFCFGLLNFHGSLMAGYVAILCLSIYTGFYSVRKIRKDRRLIKTKGLVWGILAILVFLVISIIWHHGRLFMPGDEFTHWGTIVKHMYITDAFGTIPGSTILLKSYLPGISLFEYFFVALSSGFKEWTLYVAMSLLFFAIIAHVTSGLDTVRKTILAGTFIASSLLFTYSFDYLFINALSVDVVLALLFAFTITSVVRSEAKIKPYDVLAISAGCMMLVLAKDMGLVLVAVCLLVYAMDLVIFKRKYIVVAINNSKFKRHKMKTIALLNLPVLFSAVPYILWKFNTEVNRVQPWFDASSINIANVIKGDLQPYQTQVVASFIDRIVSSHISGLRISYLTTMVIFLVGMSIVALVQKEAIRSKRIAAIGVVVTVGAALYAGALLMLYMFVFHPSEAVALASYSRYLGAYALGAMLILLTVAIYRETRLSQPLQKLSVYVVACISAGIEYIKKHLFLILLCGACIVTVGKLTHMRSYISERVVPYFTLSYERVDENSAGKWEGCLSNPRDTLNIVSSGDNGSRTTQLRYIFYGVAAQIPTGITGPINQVKTTPKYSDYWGEYVLKENTLVYVDRYDMEFYKKHAGDFDELKDNQLYRITKANNETRLKSIDANSCTVMK